MEEEVSIREMESVVEAYIKERKRVNVRINIQEKLPLMHPFFRLSYLQDQLVKLNSAYTIAKSFFAGKAV